MTENRFIADLRATGPNTKIHVGKPYQFAGSAKNLLTDWDALVAERDRWKAEAEKWQRIASKLSDTVCKLADRQP